MATEKKKAKDPAKITPTQMRLGADTLSDIDLISAERETETAMPHTRTDVVRYLVKREADRIRKRKEIDQ